MLRTRLTIKHLQMIHAIESNENLRLIAQVDHAAGAASVGLDLRPTIEIFFVNPALGNRRGQNWAASLNNAPTPSASTSAPS